MRKEISMKTIAPVLENPRERGLLLLGFKAWSGPQPDSEPALREQLAPASSRAVWDLERGRIAFTVNEHRSVQDALVALADELESNQLAELPRGPEDLGEVSFVHPPQAPPAVFFVRGNLTLGVFSFGREPVDVVPFARRVDAELRATPSGAREGNVELREDRGGLRIDTKYPSRDAYVKVVARGAALSKSGEAVSIEGRADDVEVYYLEPGREPQRATAGRGKE